MLTVSTAHITEKTAIGLDEARKNADASIDLCVYGKEGYGFFVHIPDDWQDGHGVPPDLADCIRLADENGCEWLCLDRDGEVTGELRVYEWEESE